MTALDASGLDRLLDGAIAMASTDELRAVRRLLHVAVIRQQSIDRRLATPARIVDEPYPPIVAALCELVTAELARRGEGIGSCPPCAAATRGIVSPSAAAEA